MNNIMTLDDTLKIIQIIFYVAVATIATLTYLSAKKGLLNTVNTEYHKRVMDKLDILSQELLSEFDPDSPNYWAGKDIVIDCLKEIHETFDKYKDEILKAKKFSTGIPDRPDFRRLINMVQKTKSDPFIPPKVREYIVRHLEVRAEKLFTIHMEEIDRYITELATGKVGSQYNHNAAIVHNRINDRLYNAGCGISQVEEQVHSIRIFIQEYLEEFNPLR